MASKPELRKVRRAADKAASARQDLDHAVRSATQAGLSLREVAQAAGISHEQVRRLSHTAEDFDIYRGSEGF